MATTVRSIGAMPFQGGSFTTDRYGHSMVRLSNSRMIWMYYQTNPNWLAASVIDVAGGITGTGAATLTNQQLLMPATQTGYMHTARINANTFVMFTGNPSGNFWTSNWAWSVFEVDSGGVFTRVDSGTLASNTTNLNANWAFGHCNFRIVELKDNLVMYVGNTVGNTVNTVSALKGSYDINTKKMTWDANATNLFSLITGYNGIEITARPVPGRDYTMIQARYLTNLATPLDNRGASGVVVNNQTGAVVTPANKLPLNSINTGNPNSNGDMVPLPGDRIAHLTSNYSIQWFSIDYVAGSFINLGAHQFCATQNADAMGHYLLPLTTDYVLKVQRQPFFSPTTNPHRLKVIRRVDQQMSEQSAASINNANAGFAMNAAPTTIAGFIQNQPELIDGKLVWFGLDSATNPQKFSWTVASLLP